MSATGDPPHYYTNGSGTFYNPTGSYYSTFPNTTPGQFVDSWTTSNITLNQTVPRYVAVAERVHLAPDGYIVLDSGNNCEVRVPPSLFKDLLAFAEMGILEKLCPEDTHAE